MKDEDKELVDRLNEGGCGVNCDTLCSSAATAIERLSAEVEEITARYEARARDAQYFERRVCELKEELAALRAQIAEAQPVAWWFQPPDKRLAPKFDTQKHGGKWSPLYAHTAADANDAERYRFIRTAPRAEAIRLTHYGFDALDAAIDAAIKGGA